MNLAPGLPSWTYFTPREHEQIDEWRWPTFIDAVDMMLHDAQVAALKQAIGLPVQRYRLSVDPNGMDLARAALLADDVDLPLAGQEASAGRSPLRFNHRRHFARSLSCLDYGPSLFEKAGEIRDGLWRLTDLQPIPLRTIAIDGWDVDRAGRLRSIKQQDYRLRDLRIPADHLVVYTWGGAVGDPVGESMFRPVWRAFAAKDRLVRLDMVKHERNALGIPVGWVSEGASRGDADAMDEILGNMAAGEDAYVRLQRGEDFKLRGVEGQTSDTLASIKFHNEEMGRALLSMVLQAGQTGNGTLTSAETHDSYLRMFHDVIVQHHCDVFTEQVLATWCRLNDGPDAPVARVAWDREEVDVTLSPSGAVGGNRAPVAASGRRVRKAPAGRARRPVAAAADVPVPDRRLRRQPTVLEAASGVDFAQVDEDWQTVTDQVAGLLAGLRDDLAAVALDAIRDMDTVDPLTLADMLAPILRSAADEQDTDALREALEQAARDGIEQVVGEVDRQGRSINPPDLDYTDRAQLEAANAARRLAASLTETASNAALTSSTPGAAGTAVADAVADAVDRLTDAQPQQAAAGATSRAQNAGRAHAIDTADYVEIYGSSLLDRNTCGPCIDWDGRTFDTLDEAMDQFPGGGGNKDCEGMDRCRCILVAVLATEQERAT